MINSLHHVSLYMGSTFQYHSPDWHVLLMSYVGINEYGYNAHFSIINVDFMFNL